MHPEAMQFLANELGEYRDAPVDVLEIGSRDINGSPRSLFNLATYYGIDIADGPGVDQVADAATWRSIPLNFDFVICAEVFEHAPRWRDICTTAFFHLRDGGSFIGTAAGIGRRPHSAVDGEHLQFWMDANGGISGTPSDDFGIPVGRTFTVDVDSLEFYENIGFDPLFEALHEAGFNEIVISEDREHGDIYWKADK